MVRILYVTLMLILILYIDGIDIFKSKDLKKITAYSSFFFTAGVLNLLLIMDVKIPNPMEAVQVFIISIFGKS